MQNRPSNKYRLSLDLQTITAFSLVAFLGASASSGAFGQAVDEVKEKNTEEIVVVGTRKSLQDAIDTKKRATQILDAISAEDAGKLPDLSVTDAMQRITGVQVTSHDDTGDAADFQIRGLDQNRVEMNGRTMNGGLGAVPTALSSGIEVIKSQRADMSEGGVGGTVRLKTFKPLDFKKRKIAFSGEGSNSSLDTPGHKLGALFGDNLDLEGFGRVGAVLNLTREKRNSLTQNTSVNDFTPIQAANITVNDAARKGYVFNNVQIHGTTLVPNPVKTTLALPSLLANPDSFPKYSVYRPNSMNIESKAYVLDQDGVDATLQWAPNDDLTFTLQATKTTQDRNQQQSRLVLPLNDGASRLKDGYVIETFTRPDDERFLTALPSNVLPRPYLATLKVDTTPAGYKDATGDVTRGIMTSGTITNVPVRTAANNNIFTNNSDMFAFKTVYVSDDWGFDFDINQSTSEEISDNFNTALNVALRPDVTWDSNTKNDIPTIHLTFPSDVNLLSTSAYTWNNFTGQQTFKNTKDREAKLDVDYEFNRGGFTTLEFGIRATNELSDRTQFSFGPGGIGGGNANTVTPLPDGFDYTKLPGYNPAPLTAENTVNNPGSSVLILPAGTIAGTTKDTAVFAFAGFYYVPPATAGGASSISVVPGTLPNIQAAATRYGYPSDFIDSFWGPTIELFKGSSGDVVKQWLGPKDFSRDKFNYYRDVLTPLSKNQTQSATYPFDIDVKTQSIYALGNFESEAWGYPFTGNLGVRYVHTDSEVVSRNVVRVATDTQAAGTVYKEPSVSKYNNILPSGNISFMLREDMQLRFAASRAMRRPNSSDLSSSILLDSSNNLNGKQGNPSLKPYLADSFDMSYEWYIDKISSFNAALFYKKIINFTSDFRYVLPLPSKTTAGAVDEYIITSKQNNEDGGYSQGFEIQYTTAFDSLPYGLDGFGIQTNYTYTDSSQATGFSELDASAIPLANLSENSYNFTLFYQKYGFDIRLAYNWRDDFYNGLGAGLADPQYYVYDQDALLRGQNVIKPYNGGLPEYSLARGNLDASIQYRYKKFTLNLSATNVTREIQYKYAGVKSAITDSLDNGTIYRAGLRIDL